MGRKYWWQQLFGVSLYGVRFFMVLVGLANAITLYFVSWQWWGTTAAGIAAGVFAVVSTSPTFSALARMDALGMLVNSLALLLHIYAVRKNNRWLHFATGIAIVATAEFHILGVLYLAGITLYYMVEYIRDVISQRRILFNHGALFYAAGGLIAGIVYIVIHILPDPDAYFVISNECFQCAGSSLSKEITRWTRFLILRGMEAPLLLLVIIAALFRREREDWHFLIIFAGWMIALVASGPPPFTHYTYHIWLLIALGMGGFIAHGFRAGESLREWRVVFGLATAVILLLGNFGLHMLGYQPFELRDDTLYEEHTEAIAYIQENIPTDVVIMSDVTLFYPLKEYRNFMSYRNGYEYGAGRKGIPIIDYWRTEQPLVILGGWQDEDPDLATYIDEIGFEEVLPGLWVATSLLE